MISLLLTILLIVLVAWVAFWFIDSSGMPSPMNWIVKSIIALVALLTLLSKTGVIGTIAF